MNEIELPRLGEIAALLLFSAPFLLLALRRASRMLPRRDAAPFRWSALEGLVVVAAPFVTVVVLQALLGAPAEPGEEAPGGVGAVVPHGDVLQIAASQLVLGTAAVLALVLARRRAHGLEALGWNVPAPARAYAAVPLVYVPLYFFAAGLVMAWLHLSRALGWPERQEVMQMILDLRGGELVFAAVVAVLVAPLVEELVFRGFLLSFLVQVLGPATGFLLTALLFALLHGITGLPVLLAISLFLGWLQVRTRSLWPSYAAHVLNNGVTLGLALALGVQ